MLRYAYELLTLAPTLVICLHATFAQHLLCFCTQDAPPAQLSLPDSSVVDKRRDDERCQQLIFELWKARHGKLSTNAILAALSELEEQWTSEGMDGTLKACCMKRAHGDYVNLQAARVKWDAVRPSNDQVLDAVLGIRGVEGNATNEAVHDWLVAYQTTAGDERTVDWGCTTRKQVDQAQATARKSEGGISLCELDAGELMRREERARDSLRRLGVWTALPPRASARVEVRAAFVAALFGGDCTVDGQPFDRANDTHWVRLRWRYLYASSLPRLQRPTISDWRYRARQELDYTVEEAQFCDQFDGFANRWERDQQALVDAGVPLPCDKCDERRPPWMSKIKVVRKESAADGTKQYEAGLRSDDLRKLAAALQASGAAMDATKAAELLVAAGNWDHYVALMAHHRMRLCDRCRAPSLIEKKLCMHKFSVENHAHPTKMPTFDVDGLDHAELEAQLRAKPEFAFAIAWEAELALIRMTIPW